MRVFLACAGVLTPVVLMVLHPVFHAAARSGPQALVGYRTRRARSSLTAWRVAQVACARIWLRTGAASTVLAVAAFGALAATDAGPVWWETASVVFALVPLVAAVVCSLLRIEPRLRAHAA